MFRIAFFSAWLAFVPSLGHAQSRPASAPTPEAEFSEAEARALFEAGFAAYEAGRYSDALGHFERAYERSGRAGLLFNVGQCHDRLREDERAIEAFERYLRELPNAENRIQVEARIRALREGIARRSEPAPEPQVPTEPVVVPTPTETATRSIEVGQSGPAQPTPLEDRPSHRGRRIALISTGAAVVVAAVVLTVLLVRDTGGGYSDSDVGTVFALSGGRR